MIKVDIKKAVFWKIEFIHHKIFLPAYENYDHKKNITAIQPSHLS